MQKEKSHALAVRLIAEGLRSCADSPCLLWPAYRDGDGYGRAYANGKSYAVHRKACEAINGPAPADKPHALHRCGRGRDGCFNPHHLYWGDYADNVADAMLHNTRPRGRSCGGVLSDEEALIIRAMSAAMSDRKIAARFGVSRSTVQRVVRGLTYQHVS